MNFKSYYWAIGAAALVLIVVLAVLPFVFKGEEKKESPHSAEDLAAMNSDPIDYTPQINAYQELITANPNDAVAYAGLGGLYTQTGRYSEAIDQLNKSLSIDPSQELTYGILGIAYFQMGMPDLAIDQLNKGLAVKPDSQPLLFDLGAVYAQTGEADKAISLWQKAYEIEPGNEIGHMAQQLITQQQNPSSTTPAPPLDQ